MFFDLQDDVKSDDVILRGRGGPNLPIIPPTCRNNPARTPPCRIYLFAGVRLGRLNVSVTDSPIGCCEAGLGFLGSGLMGRGSLGYLPGRGFRPVIATCSGALLTGLDSRVGRS